MQSEHKTWVIGWVCIAVMFCTLVVQAGECQRQEQQQTHQRQLECIKRTGRGC
jgi:hypothetical protein